MSLSLGQEKGFWKIKIKLVSGAKSESINLENNINWLWKQSRESQE